MGQPGVCGELIDERSCVRQVDAIPIADRGGRCGAQRFPCVELEIADLESGSRPNQAGFHFDQKALKGCDRVAPADDAVFLELEREGANHGIIWQSSPCAKG